MRPGAFFSGKFSGIARDDSAEEHDFSSSSSVIAPQPAAAGAA